MVPTRAASRASRWKSLAATGGATVMTMHENPIHEASFPTATATSAAQPAASLFNSVKSLAKGIAGWIDSTADLWAAAALDATALRRLSDAELHKRGLSRDTLARDIFNSGVIARAETQARNPWRGELVMSALAASPFGRRISALGHARLARRYDGGGCCVALRLIALPLRRAGAPGPDLGRGVDRDLHSGQPCQHRSVLPSRPSPRR